jgi:hypothetical protein
MNSDSKSIFINNIGNIVLQKKSIAKYLGIRIKPFEGIFVTVPKRVSYKEAEEFVRSREDWILKHLPKIQKIENSKPMLDENTIFKTKEHNLVIKKSMVEETIVSINEDEIKIEYPWLEDVTSDKIQDKIKTAIIFTLRLEAKKHIPRRVKELAYLYGFEYNKVTVKNLKSRWGSCSGRNNINLNIHLMKLPNELIDYVVLHELVHTIHKNHSKRFWNALENILPNSKKLDRALKQYSPHKY